jgi:hypothetical protein
MKTLSLRLPDDVYEQIARLAVLECRSITQEIEFALRRYAAAYAEQGPIELQIESALLPSDTAPQQPRRAPRKARQSGAK